MALCPSISVISTPCALLMIFGAVVCAAPGWPIGCQRVRAFISRRKLSSFIGRLRDGIGFDQILTPERGTVQSPPPHAGRDAAPRLARGALTAKSGVTGRPAGSPQRSQFMSLNTFGHL